MRGFAWSRGVMRYNYCAVIHLNLDQAQGLEIVRCSMATPVVISRCRPGYDNCIHRKRILSAIVSVPPFARPAGAPKPLLAVRRRATGRDASDLPGREPDRPRRRPRRTGAPSGHRRAARDPVRPRDRRRYQARQPDHCDAGRIGQLLSTLLANAPTHGTAATLHVSAREAGGRIELSVSNSGHAPASRASDWGSNIVFEIARAHGGTFTATS